MKQNKEKQRRYGFYIIILFLLSLIIGCSTLFLGGNTSSSSSASSLPASSSASSSSTTPSSTVEPSSEGSSSVTPSSEITSSTPSSSEATSSSSSSSETLNGPRLTLLEPDGTLTVLGGTQLNSVDYFVTKDSASTYLSGFNGNTLLFKHLIGDAVSVFINPLPIAIAPYHEGFLFFYYANFAPKTVYVTSLGVQQTFENIQLVPFEQSLDHTTIYAVDTTDGNELIRFVSPSLTPVSIGNLTSGINYAFITNEYTHSQMTTPVSIPDSFFTISGVNMSTFRTVFEFYNKETLDLVLTFSPQDAGSGKELIVSENGLTVLDVPQRKVTHYTDSGVDFELTNVTPFPYAANQAFMVNEQFTGITRVYKDATLLQTFTNGNVTYLTNSERDGSSFVVNYFDGSSEIYAIEENLVLLADFSTRESVIINASDVPTQVIAYDEVSSSSTIIMYSVSLYGNSNYVDLTFTGDLRSTPIQYYVASESTSFGIQFVAGQPADPDNVTIKTNQNNQLNTYAIENKNIVNLIDVGQVGDFLLLNAALGSTSNYKGIVMDVTDGTIYELDKKIDIITPQLGDSVLPIFVGEGQLIHAYGPRGIATIDLNALTFTAHDSTDGVTATINYSLKENFFSNNDELIIKSIEPFPNPSNTATISLYRANFNEGMDDFILLGEGTVDPFSLGNSLFVLEDDALIQIDRSTQELFTIYAEVDIVRTTYYLVDEMYYILSETYEETNTLIPEAATFSLF